MSHTGFTPDEKKPSSYPGINDYLLTKNINAEAETVAEANVLRMNLLNSMPDFSNHLYT